MKSALANIGEDETAKLAYELEQAGLDGNMAFIAGNTVRLIESLEALINSLRPAEAAVDAGAETAEDAMILLEQLRMLETACENYDDTAAYAVLDRLKENARSHETSAALENIRDMLFLHSDFEGAAERVRELSGELSV
jgi:hypothetical protein